MSGCDSWRERETAGPVNLGPLGLGLCVCVLSASVCEYLM